METSMDRLLSVTLRLTRVLNTIAGFTLIGMMLLTVSDVTLRLFRKPILGTYEIVSLSLGVVIGFAVPFTSWIRGHIYVDFLINKFPSPVTKAFNIVTRCLVIALFILLGIFLINLAAEFYKSGEVSLTLKMPFYPVAFAIGLCCFIQCLVLLTDILKIARGKYE